MVLPRITTPEQCKNILQTEIDRHLREGFRVLSQTDFTAQLVKPKKFSGGWIIAAILGLLFWVVGAVVVVILYALTSEETIHISVSSTGLISYDGKDTPQKPKTNWDPSSQ